LPNSNLKDITNVDDLWLKYEGLVEENNFESALLYLKRILEILPESPEALFQMAFSYYELNQYQLAIKYAEEALKYRPDGSGILYNLGLYCEKLHDDYKSSIDYYKRALQIKPEYKKALNNLANLYSKLKKFNLAFNLFKKVVKLDPFIYDLWYNIGHTYCDMEDYSNAINCFHQELATNPNNWQAWGMLGVAYCHLDNFNTAIACFRKSLEINPNDETIQNNLEITLEDLDTKEKSIDLNKLIKSTNETRNFLIERWKKDALLVTERDENLRKILKRFTKISVNEITDLLEFTSTLELKRWLIELPEDISFKVDDEYVIFNQQLTDVMVDTIVSSISKHQQAFTCMNCGLPIEKDTKTCPDCGIDIVCCVVCKLPISFGDETVTCPQCEAVGHDVHFYEWIKTNGSCPRCKHQLKL